MNANPIRLHSVRVCLLLVSVMVQGCAIRVGGPGMPMQPMGVGGAGPLTAATPLSGPVAGLLPQAPTGNLLGVPGGSSPTGGFQPQGGALAAGSSTQLDGWQGGKLPPEQFFRLIAPAVLASSRQTGVPAAVTMAQAALETGYGKSTIGDAKNLFGVRGTGPAGSISAIDAGQRANFKKYNSFTESISDHDRLLATGSRYAGARAVAGDPERFAREIHRAGYATDPGYADNLISIMRQYNLSGVANA